MKIAIIDIGSNSVRLMLWADGKTLYKKMKTTRLGEGLNFSPYLTEAACLRTAEAVAEFKNEVEADGAERVYAFATAAVRSAENSRLFLDKVIKLCGLDVDVLSGEKEAEIGLAGALNGADGGIIDVGGASTEVTVCKDGKIVYEKSVNIGTVRIFDAVGRNLRGINAFIAERLTEYGKRAFSQTKMYAVGGTATRLAAIKHGVMEYDKDKLHGTVLTVGEIKNFAVTLTEMTVEEIRRTTICSASADVIGCGAALLAAVMENFGIKQVTVSESDNLEGYAQFLMRNLSF